VPVPKQPRLTKGDATMQAKTKLPNSAPPGPDKLLRSAARLLAEDLPPADLFSRLAALLDNVFDIAIFEVALVGEAREKYRYESGPAAPTATDISLPIVFHAERMGVLRIVRKMNRPFSSADVDVLETCALLVAVRLNQSEMQSARERSEELAGIDPLTGIASRRSFATHFEAEWTRGMRHGGLLSVLMVDVDHFKDYNDRYGHVAGDANLQRIAQCINRCVTRASDMVARYGGEEFAVVLPLTDHAGAIAIAEKIRIAILGQRMEHTGDELGIVTVSIGVATETPLQSTSSTGLLEKADVALYLAKTAGRNVVCGEDYQSDGALAVRAPIQSNLPPQSSTFFGRITELDALEYLFTQTRALTLTGLPGIGKTRVAQHWARCNIAQYPDGVWFADLARVTDAALVVGSLMFVLGESEQQGKQPLASLTDQVGDQTMLIVLDNCQRLIEECAATTEALLRKCPNVRIMATCRNRLNIGGEIAYRIPPMPLVDAADLFMARASAVDPSFAVTPKNRLLVERIVSRLDKIPMAIEIAAARVKIMSATDLDAGLEARFPVPSLSDRPVRPRAEILPVLVDWSYDLLDPEERESFRRLAIFPGDWDMRASVAVCAPQVTGETSHSDILGRLLGKALILSEPYGSEIRYSMFETLREYGRNLLKELGQFDDLLHRHAAYYCEIAEELEREREGADISTDDWLGAVEIEHHNFRAALEWSVLSGGDLRTGAALATALAAWWAQTRHFREGKYWIDHIIWKANESDINADLRKRLLSAASLIGRRQEDIVSK
jgi:diguanylate cyclase (GGDEF)-like protein